jgi:manganese oxidase
MHPRPSMTILGASRLISLVLACAALVCLTRALGAIHDASPPEIVTHTNQVAAGRMAGQSLYLDLEVREGLWYPETKDGPGLLVQAFAERGKPPSIPGPLLRVREGTRILASVHNLLDVDVALHGFHTRPGDAKDVISIPAGKTQQFDFTVGAAGIYHYYGSTMEGGAGWPTYKDANLSGAFVVDPKDAKAELDDRIFMIGAWRESPDLDRRLRDVSLSAADRARLLSSQRATFTINGLSWPYTERLRYRESQRVRWRWINTSNIPHPMHLHGFYFDVESVGDGERDTPFREEHRPHVVTQKMQIGSTLSMSWTPDRAGNWLFHCHMIEHISPNQRLRPPATHTKHDAHDDSTHVTDGMAGLVLGIHVSASDTVKPSTVASQRHKLQLFVHEQPGRFGGEPAMGYALRKSEDESPPNEVSLPGPTIVLTRGEPVSIEITNTIREPTSIHWHGIELDSYFDGVPGWGGHPRSVTPSIAPGGSFVAEMTPPRAGTFIYHTHSHDDRQLMSGMYGALVVLEPGQRYDPVTDRLLLISVGGPNTQRLRPPEVPIFLNGSANPKPMELQVGVTYRLRIINITADNVAFNVHLLAGDEYVDWRPLAKDGADLPTAQRIVKRAIQPVGVGETYDVEYRPERPGDLRFEVRSGAGATRVSAAIRVR